MIRRILTTLVLVLAVAACSETETTLSTGSTVLTGGTTETTTISTTTTPADSPPTTLRGQVVTEVDIVARLSTANGEVLHIVIPMGGYTDVDLENFIVDLKEGDPELWGAEVFDDPDAPAAFAVDEANRSDEQRALLEDHHLVSLVEGEIIRFQGPFADLGETIIGS
ncbi:MAG: hypothetical protein L0Z47_04940 [Actinobacteria bacterium]|nr:hypothetical protein [Actinomycetota bacterium]